MRRFWGLGLGLAFTILGITLSLWYFIYRDTSVYPAQFSDEQFARIHIGMTMNEVTTLLGPPLSIDNDSSPESWTYLTNSREKSRSILGGDLSQVVFSPSGEVASVSGPAASLVKPGMSRHEVTRIIGSPRWRSGPRSKAMHYSQPSGYGTFHARIVEVDNKGRVTNLVTYHFMD